MKSVLKGMLFFPLRTSGLVTSLEGLGWESACHDLEKIMATEWASRFYTSIHWIRCRDGFRRYKRGLCEECLKHGIVTPGTEVHHKIPLTIDNVRDPDIALNWDNLELLCTECHQEIHRHLRESNEKMHKRFKVDANGKVILREDADRLRK